MLSWTWCLSWRLYGSGTSEKIIINQVITVTASYTWFRASLHYSAVFFIIMKRGVSEGKSSWYSERKIQKYLSMFYHWYWSCTFEHMKSQFFNFKCKSYHRLFCLLLAGALYILKVTFTHLISHETDKSIEFEILKF